MKFFADNWVLFVLLAVIFVLAIGLYAAAISTVIDAINKDDIDDSTFVRDIKKWVLGHQLVKLVVLAAAPVLIVLVGLRLIGMVFQLLFEEVIPDATSASARFFAKK